MCVRACVCVCVCVDKCADTPFQIMGRFPSFLPRLCAWVQSPLLFPSFPSTIQHPLLHLADGHLSFVTFILLAIPMLGPEIVSSRCHAGHQCGSGFYWLRSSPVASLVYESRQWASAREDECKTDSCICTVGQVAEPWLMVVVEVVMFWCLCFWWHPSDLKTSVDWRCDQGRRRRFYLRTPWQTQIVPVEVSTVSGSFRIVNILTIKNPEVIIG